MNKGIRFYSHKYNMQSCIRSKNSFKGL